MLFSTPRWGFEKNSQRRVCSSGRNGGMLFSTPRRGFEKNSQSAVAALAATSGGVAQLVRALDS